MKDLGRKNQLGETDCLLKKNGKAKETNIKTKKISYGNVVFLFYPRELKHGRDRDRQREERERER